MAGTFSSDTRRKRKASNSTSGTAWSGTKSAGKDWNPTCNQARKLTMPAWSQICSSSADSGSPARGLSAIINGSSATSRLIRFAVRAKVGVDGSDPSHFAPISSRTYRYFVRPMRGDFLRKGGGSVDSWTKRGKCRCHRHRSCPVQTGLRHADPPETKRVPPFRETPCRHFGGMSARANPCPCRGRASTRGIPRPWTRDRCRDIPGFSIVGNLRQRLRHDGLGGQSRCEAGTCHD